MDPTRIFTTGPSYYSITTLWLAVRKDTTSRIHCQATMTVRLLKLNFLKPLLISKTLLISQTSVIDSFHPGDREVRGDDITRRTESTETGHVGSMDQTSIQC